MARSLKKGPFVDEHLMKKVEALNAAGKKEVSVTSYVDWTESADKFSWSFIYISSYNKAELEKLLAEINIWLKL